MEPAIAIVPMGLGHLRQVLDLGYEVFDTSTKPYTSWSLTSVAEHLDSPSRSCWVAVDSDRVVGFVLGSMEFELRDDWGYLEWIAVAPDMQGHGIAGRLMSACCDMLFQSGARRIVTDVEIHNTASASLMKRNGFSEGTTVTLFVRPNPAPVSDEAADTTDSDQITLTPGTKRELIRKGRIAGEGGRPRITR
ncbi:GNAT family N-acetyltransferase [Nocardia sp. SYP-A9097]|uniref:GNAT family N-acetyltransferase n=1 Tax=Nocardia sp. SYP-A9097 TaxID=2663237 RepID=UPI00129BE7B0|nr:GNAT family N-acetyltransferase [Nocardia sp. SYP-A9097]MRH87553.1 GNAT family N-acetyltransferase [Nocardia sp. SYP-A9097]